MIHVHADYHGQEYFKDPVFPKYTLADQYGGKIDQAYGKKLPKSLMRVL